MQNRIMIVEDEYIVSLDLKHMLEDLGHHVVASVARGEDVTPTALTCKPDLVLMDIRLAGRMSGTEAALQLRDNLDVPVVFLTAYCEESVLQEAEKSFPYGYLIKPFDRRELAATIRMASIKFRSEQNCRRSELRLRLAMQAAELSYWELNLATDTLEFHGDLRPALGGNLASGQQMLQQLVVENQRPRLQRLLQNNRNLSGIFIAGPGSDASFLEFYAQRQQVHGNDVWIGVVGDVSQQQKYELQLRQAQAVFDTTAEAILILDADGKISLSNPAFARITGYKPDEIIGLNPNAFLYENNLSAPSTPHLHELSASHWSGEVNCRKRDGSTFPAWQHICRVRSPMGRMQRHHYVVMFSDISALRRAEEHLLTLVHHDHLTGLGNRRKLEKVLHTEIQRANRNHSSVGLLYLDLDGFKLVNDTLGHHIGDLLLQRIADRVQQLTRAGDVAIRVGGDEFVLVTPDIQNASDCYAVAEKLLKTIAEDVQVGDNTVSISASIGIALYPNDAEDVTELLKCADLAMFSAKDAGRNRYAFFNKPLADKAQLRMRLERDLRQVLQTDTNQLQLYYQPIVDAFSGEICGIEALLRWFHPELGAINPERFIQVAEQSNQILELGDWVCQQIRLDIIQLRQWLRPGFYLALNLSVRQFDDVGLYERLWQYFGDLQLWPELQFELTETAFMKSDKLDRVISKIRLQGASIALDDFGTGYSSLSRLKELPLDCLKIDRSFVMHMDSDERSHSIVDAICTLAKALDLTLVAEGVETATQLQLLQQLGCDRVQGYLIAKPMPLAELRLFTEQRPRQ